MGFSARLLATSAAVALAAPALAQEAAPAAPDAADAQLSLGRVGEDIVVTARRRSESVQSVPIAISVIGGEAVSATGAYNVNRLTQLQPSLQFYSTNPRNSAANIRGLGAPFGLTNDGIEQGVGIYVDQVYYSRIASATFDFIDVSRIEVLRGPQGTLYGKNTTAGAINITTRPPSFTPEARVELTAGNLGFLQGKASVSGALVDDKVAIRLGVSATQRHGTIFNVKTDSRVNEQDNLGFRGQLLWKAADALDVTISGDYNRQNPECCAQIYARVGSTQRPLSRQYAALSAAFGYAPPSTDAFDRLTDVDTPLRAKQEIGGASLRADWDLGPGTLTSVTAWRLWNWDPSNDRDFTGLPITTVSANPSKQRQWTQEFRYSATGEAIDYTVGLFGFHQKIHTDGLQVQGAAASRWLLNPGAVPANNPAGCTPATANACNPAVLNGLTSVNQIDFKNDSVAAFGQLTWKVTDRFRVQPGLRVNYDKKTGSYVSTVTTGAGALLDCSAATQAASSAARDRCGVLAPQSYQPSFSDWNVSGDFTLSYDVATDVLGYATYAKSFKSGGINLSGLPLDANNNPILGAATVKPEKVDHFEVGLKTQFLDRRATLNLSGFWTEIRDYQATVTNNQIGVLRGYLANAGKVRVRGIEADFSLRPNERTSFYLNGAYTDHEYVKFVDAPCPPELAAGSALPAPTAANPNPQPSAAGTPGGVSPNNCDISGQWLPGISKLSLSYGAEYGLPVRVAGNEGQVYLAVDGSYRSKFSSNPSRSAYTDVRGYAITNARLGFRAEGFNLFGWVRNLFDTHYYELLATTPGNTGLIAGQPGDPRTYGVTLSKRF